MKKILFPTDFSNTSRNAYKYAQEIAELFEATLTVLHVYYPYAGAMTNSGEYAIALPDEQEMAFKRLHKFVSSNEEGDVATLKKVEAHEKLMVGFPVDEIATCAQKDDIDLIIMGTRKDHTITDKIFGSITTGTIRRASCPVMVIPEKASFRGIKNILYASNQEKDDLTGLKQALDLTRKFKSTLHYVHVRNSTEIGYKVDERIPELYAGKNEATVTLRMTTVSSKTVEGGLSNYAEENDIDLLIMLTNQKTLLENMFFESNTRKMVFRAKVPLLVYRD